VVEGFGGEVMQGGFIRAAIYVPGRRPAGSRPSRTLTVLRGVILLPAAICK
jgi:hypothetical protein